VVWQWQYNSSGRVTQQSSPNNEVTAWTYNNDGRLTQVTPPSGGATVYQYDTQGNMTSTTSGSGEVSTWTYTAGGQLLQSQSDTDVSKTYTYTAMGKVASVSSVLGTMTYQYQGTRQTQRTDALGQVIQMSYDAWGRTCQLSYPTSNRPSVFYTYDAEGQIIATQDSTGTRTYQYDCWGRRIRMVDPRGTAFATYDSVGNLTSQTDITGRLHTYSYLADGRLQMVQAGVNTGTAASVEYEYQPSLHKDYYSNDTQVERTWNNYGRVTSLVHRHSSTNAIIIGYEIVYNAIGKPSQITEQPSGVTTTYGYDTAGRMVSESRGGSQPYLVTTAYNSAGKRTGYQRTDNGIATQNENYSYNSAGLLTQVSDSVRNKAVLYGYNAKGEMTSFTTPQYICLLDYDEESNLIRLRHDYGSNTPLVTAYEYGYGADGARRWRKDHLNGVYTWFPCGVACSAGELVEVQSDLTGASWQPSALYLQGSEMVARSGEFHHFDFFGRAVAVTDAVGDVVATMELAAIAPCI
ncbi:MAG: RHS repeat protein, partial [Cytophagaceae bacterium]